MVFFEAFGVDQDVVEVCEAEVIEVFTEDGVDVGLEGCGSVGKPKWHDEVFEVTIASAECRFPLIPEGDAQEVERRIEIYLSEDGSSPETIEEFGCQREWVAVLDRG